MATMLDDETIWGLTAALTEPPIPAAESFSMTPLPDLLRAGVAINPQATALVGQAGRLSYGDLWRLAGNVAGAIAARVPAGYPVACLLPRTPEGIAGVIGCLISGRLCMVLDPANPAERQAALLADAVPAALIVAGSQPFAQSAPVLTLAGAMADRERHAGGDWDADAQLAVHFTSGSSGRPKGIVLSGRSVLFRAGCVAGRWKLTHEDRVYAASVPVASSGLAMLLGALACGARVVLTDIAAEGASAALRLIEREAVTCAMIQPAMMRAFFRAERAETSFRTMRSLRIGASALARSDVAAWRPRLPAGCTIWHSYASTEGLEITMGEVHPDETGPNPAVPVGMLQPSHDYALLGEDDRPAPPGEPGELVLRSRYIALGEWQDGRLVHGRMPPAPGHPGARVFRTGDLLRVQPDGIMCLVGRADRQVKINGVRVEPGEIEAILRAQPGVTDAAVVANTVAGSVTLHGFVASAVDDQTALIAALRGRLSSALPSALNPTRLTMLDQLPTLPSGKVDLVTLSERSRAAAGTGPKR